MRDCRLSGVSIPSSGTGRKGGATWGRSMETRPAKRVFRTDLSILLDVQGLAWSPGEPGDDGT